MLSDEGALDELLALGVKQIPLVARGTEWVNGQSLPAVAELAGIDLTPWTPLPPAELLRRLNVLLVTAARLFAQFPEERLADTIPGRPRSYSALVWHVFNVADAFLEHERGIALTQDSYGRNPAPGAARTDILRYGEDVRRALAGWADKNAAAVDWSASAAVYYGAASRHDYLERTTWHVGQHVRQLASLLADTLGIPPDRPPGEDIWRGLPMPEAIWDGA